MSEYRYLKFRKQMARNHERLLKVIIQKYQPRLPPRKREVLRSESPVDNDWQVTVPNVMTVPVNGEKRVHEAFSVLGEHHASLGQLYIDGNITIEQLRHRFFRLQKHLNAAGPYELRKRSDSTRRWLSYF